MQQGRTEDGESNEDEFSEFKCNGSSHFSGLLFIFVFSAVLFETACFLLSVLAIGDRLGEDADDHGYKTKDSEDDGACHELPSFPFFGLSFSLLLIK